MPELAIQPVLGSAYRRDLFLTVLEQVHERSVAREAEEGEQPTIGDVRIHVLGQGGVEASALETDFGAEE